MNTLHDHLFSEGGFASLLEVQGQDGVIYFPPSAVTGIPVNAILSQQEFIEEINQSTGETILRERMQATVATAELSVAGVSYFQFDAQMQVGESERWHIDPATTMWGNVNVVFSLVRKPLVRKQEGRRASI